MYFFICVDFMRFHSLRVLHVNEPTQQSSSLEWIQDDEKTKILGVVALPHKEVSSVSSSRTGKFIKFVTFLAMINKLIYLKF